MRTGTVQSDIALAPLALGALTDGVTVREMAGAYSTFIDDGVFGGTRHLYEGARQRGQYRS